MKKEFDFTHWIHVFETNAKRANNIYRDDDYLITDKEKQCIYASVQQFQRGESGEGKYIFQDAKAYIKNCENDTYIKALTLFIHEEHRHSDYLLKFMKKNAIPKQKKHWVDDVFRWLRHHGNLEVSITVLVTAEYIAAIYYKALMQATKSVYLRDICTIILEDEDIHIRFQSYALNRIQKNRNPLLNFYMRMQHKLLLAGTVPIVWLCHRKVLKAGNYNFISFFMEALGVYNQSNIIIKASDKELLQQDQSW